MKCKIQGSNLKVLNKASEALAKLSDEVHIECHVKGITLSASNLPKTAYGKFNFDLNFFAEYEFEDSTTQSTSFACKFYTRCLITVFRRKIEKKVETCKIMLQSNADEILFRLNFKSDATLIHKFHLIEWEGLTANYNIPNPCSVITAKSNFLSRVLNNFQASDLQLYMHVNTKTLVLKNYSLEHKLFKGIHSQVNIHEAEFFEFKIQESTALLFPIKAFKSIIAFADSCSADLCINFTTGGEPLYLTVTHPTHNVLYLVSTLQTGITNSQLSDLCLPSSEEITAKSSRVEVNPNENDMVDDIDWTSDLVLVSESVEQSGAQTSETSGPQSKRLKPSCNDDTLPEIDPKIATVFARCFEPTFKPGELDLGEIFVENSDSDDEDDP